MNSSVDWQTHPGNISWVSNLNRGFTLRVHNRVVKVIFKPDLIFIQVIQNEIHPGNIDKQELKLIPSSPFPRLSRSGYLLFTAW